MNLNPQKYEVKVKVSNHSAANPGGEIWQRAVCPVSNCLDVSRVEFEMRLGQHQSTNMGSHFFNVRVGSGPDAKAEAVDVKCFHSP